MNRIFAAASLLFLLLVGAPAAFAAPVDQAGWNARKQSLRLPNGVRLSYVELGNPKGAPVLLLHGWTDSSRAWTILAPRLLRHRLLIPDQRGHGGSDAPACCYSLSTLADDARLFLDVKGIRRAAVVGHSLGSLVAQVLAAESPERVSKLVLIGSTALVPIRRGDWVWKNVSALSWPIDPRSRFMREWSPSASPTPVDPDYAAHADREIAAVPRHVWNGVMRELVDVAAGRFTPDITAPTLILSGGRDELFPAEHHHALVAAISHAEARVFPALGHNLILERPDEVGAALADFLAGRKGPPVLEAAARRK